MRNNSKILLTAVLSVFTLGACQKDFLERKPQGTLDYATFFENGEQAQLAVNAVYNQYRQWNCVAFPWIGLTDVLSDDADKGSTPTDALYMLELDDFTFDATNTAFSGAWQGHYQAIGRANIAISRIPDVPDMDAAFRQRLMGECQFLRAHSYFLLVQWFGALPLVTRPLTGDEYYTQTRQPVSAVYAQIETDLLAAISALPEKSAYPAGDLGRATKGAARGILAKLYMVQKEYAKAEAQCDALIASKEYSLLPRYADNFMPGGENGAESIFEIQAAALAPQDGVTGPGATPYNMIQGVRGIPNLGWGFNRPSNSLVSAYENGDPRREATIIYVGEVLPDGTTEVQDNPEIVNERYNQKAWVPAHTGLQDNGPGNIRILRYADVLLLAAEAKNELGKTAEALSLLNQVRARARGASSFLLPDVTVTDQGQLRERIYRERRVELAMEQHRWFDLARWGRLGEVLKAAGKNFVDAKHELLPIPQSEVDLTGGKIEQNRGY